MSRFFKIHLRNILIGAVGFGVGTIIAAIFSDLVLGSGPPGRLRDLYEAGRLGLGITLIILIVGIGGALGGAIGGLALGYVRQSARKVGDAWPSALAFGIGNALVLTPLAITISIIALYGTAESSPITLMVPLGLVGAVFGMVCGLILGLLTVGRNTWRIVLFSTLGFALGGAGFGYDLWWYFFGEEPVREAAWLPFVGFLVFGAFGGGALGYIYSWLTHRIHKPPLIPRLIARFKHAKIYGQIAAIIGLILAFLAIRGLWLISPFSAEVASLASTLESRTVGTHWATPANLAEPASQPAVFAGEAGDVAIAWAREADIYFADRTAGEDDWSEPVNVSSSAPNRSGQPQLVKDHQGQTHLVWTEAFGADASAIFYSRCTGSTCTPPVSLSNLAGLDCVTPPATQNDAPSIAIDQNDTLMVVWRNGTHNLLYNTWPASADPPEIAVGCIPTDSQTIEATLEQARLSSSGIGSFSMVFAQRSSDQNGEIYLTQYANDRWAAAPERLGDGVAPEIVAESSNQMVAWCDANHQITLWTSMGEAETIAFPGCTNRPVLVRGEQGLPRVIWYANEVENVSGRVKASQLIYESVKTDAGWTEPAIVAQTNGVVQPAVAGDADGTLHLVWDDVEGEDGNLYYAGHAEYNCGNVPLSNAGQAIYDVLRQERFRPAADPIPFCDNQYDRLIYAPNPEPAYSNQTPSPNGPFDHFAELAKTARYEVDFSTMWYDKPANQDSPGSILAQGVADLYQQLKANPSRYPRGLTVRLLLDNPPTFALFPTFNNQVRTLLEDLRAAGITEMSNPDLGWNLEIANFGGSWPHSHTKMMVVDGKTVISAGYNLQYAHFPEEHPSGLGKDKYDLGLQITGPVAQESLRAFDDLWEASTRVYCSNLDPESSFWWMFSCRTESATAEHVSEVLQYYVPAADSQAFSLHRTQAFPEGDEAFYEALASARSSIDIVQVNFTLQVVCDLGVLLEVCNFANRIEPLDALAKAVETNQARVRVLVKQYPIDGVENRIAIKALLDELENRGLSEYIEIKYFNAKQVHAKAVLIDEDLLIVGSQNFHYSAWGDQTGLTEYNLATDDPAAVQEFKTYFDYQWERALPLEEEPN